MVTVPIVWFSLHADDGIIPRGYWDQGLLERMFSGRFGTPAGWPELEHWSCVDADSRKAAHAVYVIPAQHHVDDIERINACLSRHRGVVVILTGDEAGIFPAGQLEHRNMRIWKMTPHPGARFDRAIPDGCHPDTGSQLWNVFGPEPPDKTLSVQFRGQVNHRRREECVEYAAAIPDASIVTTDGFTQGIPRDRYLAEVAASRVVLCPSGVTMPSSFRIYEALEAGAVPIVDEYPPQDWDGFWPINGDPPFPRIKEWRAVSRMVRSVEAHWWTHLARTSTWWLSEKHRYAQWFVDDLAAVGAITRQRVSAADNITVVITTSPVPSNPALDHIAAVIQSVRERPELAAARIVIGCDGVRPEQAHLEPVYREFVRTVLWNAHHNPYWGWVDVVVAPEHLHQALTAKLAVATVDTPLMLFMEHDTPMRGEIPMTGLANAMLDGGPNVIRFHHEAAIHPEHQHMMLDKGAVLDLGPDRIPVARTVQWSQRPHLAKTDYYRWILNTYFGPTSRTMIEDAMHGVVHQAWRRRRDWATHAIAIYHPEGNISRSWHTDARENESKFEDKMIFAYHDDDHPPEDAPAPTSKRVD